MICALLSTKVDGTFVAPAESMKAAITLTPSWLAGREKSLITRDKGPSAAEAALKTGQFSQR